MRNRIVATLCAALVMMFVVMISPVSVLADAAPESIVLSDSQIIIDLAESEYASLSAAVLPSEADQDVDWSSSNRDVVRSSSRGRRR